MHSTVQPTLHRRDSLHVVPQPKHTCVRLRRAEANLESADCIQQAAARDEYQAGQCKGKTGRRPEDTTPTMTWTLLSPAKAAFPVHNSNTAQHTTVTVYTSANH